MDHLILGNTTFPVRRATLSRLKGEASDYCWCIEIYCGPADPARGSAEADGGQSSFADAEPYLYAQMLPLRIESPKEAIGRTYSFPDTPNDDPPGWACDQWPFFCLYLWEHDLVYPTTLNFIDESDGRYRVRIEGRYIVSEEESQPFHAEAWLDVES